MRFNNKCFSSKSAFIGWLQSSALACAMMLALSPLLSTASWACEGNTCPPTEGFHCNYGFFGTKVPTVAPETSCGCLTDPRTNRILGFDNGGSKSQIANWLNSVRNNPAGAGYPHLADDPQALNEAIRELQAELNRNPNFEDSYGWMINNGAELNGCVWFVRVAEQALSDLNNKTSTAHIGELDLNWSSNGTNISPPSVVSSDTLPLAKDDFASAGFIKLKTDLSGAKYPAGLSNSKLTQAYLANEFKAMVYLTLYGSEWVQKYFPKYKLGLPKDKSGNPIHFKGAYLGYWPDLLGFKEKGTGAILSSQINKNWNCDNGSPTGIGVANVYNNWLPPGSPPDVFDYDQSGPFWSNQFCPGHHVMSGNHKTYAKDAGKLFQRAQRLAENMILEVNKGRILGIDQYLYQPTDSRLASITPLRRIYAELVAVREAIKAERVEQIIQVDAKNPKLNRVSLALAMKQFRMGAKTVGGNGNDNQYVGVDKNTGGRVITSLQQKDGYTQDAEIGNCVEQLSEKDPSDLSNAGKDVSIEGGDFSPSKVKGNNQFCLLAAAETQLEMGLTLKYLYSEWAIVTRTMFARGLLSGEIFQLSEREPVNTTEIPRPVAESAPPEPPTVLKILLNFFIPSAEAAWPCGGPSRVPTITCKDWHDNPQGTLDGQGMCDKSCGDFKTKTLDPLRASIDDSISKLQADNANGQNNAAIKDLQDQVASLDDRYTNAYNACLNSPMQHYEERKWQGLSGCRPGTYDEKLAGDDSDAACGSCGGSDTGGGGGAGGGPGGGGGGTGPITIIIGKNNPLTPTDPTQSGMQRVALGYSSMACAPGKESSPECLASKNDGSGQLSAAQAGGSGSASGGNGGAGGNGDGSGAGSGSGNGNGNGSNGKGSGAGFAGGASGGGSGSGGGGGGGGGSGGGSRLGSAKTDPSSADTKTDGSGLDNSALLAALDKDAGKGAYQQGAGGAGSMNEAGGAGGFGNGFGSGGRNPASAGGDLDLSKKDENGNSSPWANGNPMLSADPSDYFSRIGIDESIFKKVERRYTAKAVDWKVGEMQTQMKPASPATGKRKPASAEVLPMSSQPHLK